MARPETVDLGAYAGQLEDAVANQVVEILRLQGTIKTLENYILELEGEATDGGEISGSDVDG